MINLGQIVMTDGVASWIENNGININEIVAVLKRHKNEDWGDLCDEDRESNDISVKNNQRVLSCYQIKGEKIWVITEWDRSKTTVLFPSEY